MPTFLTAEVQTKIQNPIDHTTIEVDGWVDRQDRQIWYVWKIGNFHREFRIVESRKNFSMALAIGTHQVAVATHNLFNIVDDGGRIDRMSFSAVNTITGRQYAAMDLERVKLVRLMPVQGDGGNPYIIADFEIKGAILLTPP
jgi:hypothetical protein